MSSIFDQAKANYPELADKWERYAALWQSLEVPAHSILLREGEISQRAFLIVKGCLRLWFNNKGKDVTFQFILENQIVASAESYRKNLPSIFTIETLESCQLLTLAKTDFESMMAELQTIPAAMRQHIDALFERQLHYMRHFMSFIRDTPEERYRNLIQERPELIQRVPLRYIASYLGITPVSLSRIRARI